VQKEEKKLKKKAEKSALQDACRKQTLATNDDDFCDKDQVINEMIQHNKGIISFETSRHELQLTKVEIESLQNFLIPNKAFVCNFVDCIMKITSLKSAIEGHILRSLSAQMRLLKKRKIGYVSTATLYLL